MEFFVENKSPSLLHSNFCLKKNKEFNLSCELSSLAIFAFKRIKKIQPFWELSLAIFALKLSLYKLSVLSISTLKTKQHAAVWKIMLQWFHIAILFWGRILKLFTESLTRCPVIGWKTVNHRLPFFRFSPNPYVCVSYERPSSFASVIPQNQDVPARSLSLLDANTRLWGFFSSNWSTRNKALFSSTQPKGHRKYKLLKDAFYGKVSRKPTVCKDNIFFPLFLCKYKFLITFKTVLRFFLLADVAILLSYKVGKITIVFKTALCWNHPKK